jgi:integrase
LAGRRRADLVGVSWLQSSLGDMPVRAVLALVMAWATLRIGEAAGLRRTGVDPLTGTLTVANSLVEVHGRLIEGPPKTAAGRRTMTMPASVMEELADHIDRFAGPTQVFCGPKGARLRSSEWRNAAWRRAIDAAQLAPLRPHDLKHTGVAFLAAAGVDPSEIARRAGHSSVAFTYDHYGHILPEVDTAAAAKLDRLRLQARP